MLSVVRACPLREFIRSARSKGLSRLREEHVAIFDMDSKCSLSLAWHRYGDDPRLGRALAGLNELYRDAGFEPNIVMEMDQLLSAYYMAGTGAGITFIRASIPYYVGPSSDLVLYKIDHPDTSRELRAYYCEENCTELLRSFLDHMKNSPMPG